MAAHAGSIGWTEGVRRQPLQPQIPPSAPPNILLWMEASLAALFLVFLAASTTAASAAVLTAESDWSSLLNQPEETITAASEFQVEANRRRGSDAPGSSSTKSSSSEECLEWLCPKVDATPIRHHRPPPLHLHHVGHGRHGPFFEDGAGPAHVSARAGDTARLDCRVGLLHGKTVTWLHRRGYSLHLLTVGKVQYSADERVRLAFRYPSNWRLEIQRVALRDEGVYECQVATHPPRARQVFLQVTAPELRVLDEGGRSVLERYYKAGSSLELRCVAQGTGAAGETPAWRRADGRLAPGVSVNVSAVADGGVVAALRVQRAQKQHSGNYTCSLGNVATAAVQVHVLNGEEPAAVQHGGSASVHCISLFCLWTALCFSMALLAATPATPPMPRR